MKKQTVIVIFLCLFMHQMFAQTAKATIKADVKWGAYTDKKTAKQLGIEGQNTIIYGDETNLYSLNDATKIIPYVGITYHVFTLIKLNRSTLAPTSSYRFKKIKINNINSDLADVFSVGNEMYATYFCIDKKAKKLTIYAKKINKSTLAPEEKSTKLTTISFEEESRLKGFTYDMKKTPDNSKFLIFYSTGKRKEKEKIGMNVFDADLNEISSFEHQFEYLDKDMLLISEQISNDGNVSILASVREPKSDLLYKIYNFKKNEKTVSYELNLKDHRITDIQIGYNGNKLVAAGFYNDAKVVTGVKGSFIGDIDVLTGELNNLKFKEFDVTFIKDGLSKHAQKKVDNKEQKGKDELLSNVRMGDLVFTASGRTILTGESFWVVKHVVNTGKTTYTYYEYVYGNVLVLSFDKDGNNEWSQKIQKQWSTINVKLPIEYTMPLMVKGEDTYFLYRGDISKEIKASMTTSDKNGSIFMTKYTADGKEAVVPILKKLDVPGWLTYLAFAPGTNEVYGMKYVRGSGFAYCKVNLKEK